MLNRIRRLWANVVEWLLPSMPEDIPNRPRITYVVVDKRELEQLQLQLGAAEAHALEQKMVIEADAAEHTRDAETVAQLRVDLNHLKHANEVMKGKYREACELLTHRNATCEHYRKRFGEMQQLAEVALAVVVDTAREGE